jgi:hypothetical protein
MMVFQYDDQGKLALPSILKVQANIFIDRPIEQIEKTMKRINGHMQNAKPGKRIAFYFARGKLHGSTEGVSTHELRLKVNQAGLIGVYSSDCNIELIKEDLEEFYK